MADIDPQPHAPRGPLIRRDHPMRFTNPLGPRKCSAKSKQTGEPCKQWVVPGSNVCHYHGAGAPHVKKAAMERLRALQDPAIDRLTKLIDQEEFPTVAYAASRDVLDRTMGKPQEHLDVTLGASEELLARLDAWKKRREGAD